MPAPNWELLAFFEPTTDLWSYTAPTDAAWFKLEHAGEFAYPNRAVGLIADAEFTSSGKVERGEARLLWHSTDRALLFIPPPIIFTEGQRRIAIKRLARTPSYTPWQLSIYSSDVMPIYNEQLNTVKELPLSDSTPGTFPAPPYNVATPAANYRALDVNANRRKFSVTNTGNATVYLDFDPPTALNKRFISIAAGSAYVSDSEWTGTVYLWSSNNGTHSCELREFI